VETALDRELVPALLAGAFRLVIITGNAGDGKTAFLQKLAARARDAQAVMDDSLPNGCRFTLRGRRFLSNYDGSQDEGDQLNEDVLDTFFAPFQGTDVAAWPDDETRLIAINEGRLIDFFTARAEQFPRLAAMVRRGLATGVPDMGLAVVNLNWRSVITDVAGAGDAILERLVKQMLREPFWAPCLACDLRDKCYIHHNVRTFQDPTAGSRVLQRLTTLYMLTHLRGRLHITLRDLRSALAYMLVGLKDCDDIHALYSSGKAEEIVNSFYFNSWMGSDTPTGDRLLALLREVDTGASTSPRLDRQLDYISPAVDRALMTFEQRGTYDRDILQKLFTDLPRGWTGQATDVQMQAHRRFVSMARRRYFFECRDDERWRQMLPYRSAWRLLDFVTNRSPVTAGLADVLSAMNRGEGLISPDWVNKGLALQVRTVEGGSIRSYRVFPQSCFRLEVLDEASHARFVEHMPGSLVLRYEDAAGGCADLRITLDVFEMLQRLNEGYRPTVEEMQGYYLSLAVFKNVLASSPYQEILLTVTGHDFYRIAREPTTSRLRMEQLIAEGN
jgi:hypothetical protein